MAEHCLHGAQIRTIFQKVRGKRMPHSMRRDALPDAGLKSTALNNLPEALACQAFPGAVEKQELGAALLIKTGSSMLHIFTQSSYGSLAKRNNPLFAAFTECRQVTNIELQ